MQMLVNHSLSNLSTECNPAEQSYYTTANEYHKHYAAYLHLTPYTRILDIGCGAGRMGFPLINYLQPPGHYYGIDLQKSVIEWCDAHFTSSQFTFSHYDAAHPLDNPLGVLPLVEMPVPLVDCVLVVGVMQRLTVRDCKDLITVISRALVSGGRFLLTGRFFLPKDIPFINRTAIYKSVRDGCRISQPFQDMAQSWDLLAPHFQAVGLKVERQLRGKWITHLGLLDDDLIVGSKL